MSSTVEHSVKVGRCQVLNWSQFDRWVPIDHGLTSNELDTGWKWVPMHELVRQIDGREAIDEKCNYDLAGIRLDGHGIYHRESVLGGETSATYLSQLRPGAFIYGRLFAWRGAFASVKEEHAGLWCSNEFPQFEIDSTRIDADYLVRFMLHPSTLERVGKSSVGTAAMSRNRFKEVEFLNLVVPLPPLATQRSIVAHWQAGMQQAAALETKAKKLVEEAQAGFKRTLGINAPQESDQRKAFAIDFMAIDRWGVRATLTHALKGAQVHDDFPIERLGNVIEGLENGWSPKCYDRPANGTEWGVLKLGAVSFGRFNDAENKALPKAFVPKENLEVRAGDVLIIRGNVLRLVGAFAYVDATRPKLMLPDLIFRVKFKRERLLDPQFLVALMHCADLRQQIESAATGTSPTMKKVTVGSILDLEFPLPPIDRQRELLKPMTAALSQSTKLKDQAETKRKETKAEVEGMVMGTSKV